MDKLKLDDVGTTKPLLDGIGFGDWKPNIRITMGIQAPNGDTCFIFTSRPQYDNTKCEAIRAFMEQHAK